MTTESDVPPPPASPDGAAPPPDDGSGFDRRSAVLACVIALTIAFIPVFAIHLLIGGWPVNYGAPVRGRVIDEHTGRPIAGAVVVGEWYTHAFFGAHHRMHASEAVTDVHGAFVLPGMPLKIRRLWDEYQTYDPVLAVYKPGYGVVFNATNIALERPGNRPYSRAMKRVSYWDGKVLMLQPADGIKSEAESLARIYSIANRSDEMHPRDFPRVWTAIVQGAARIPSGAFGSSGDPRPSYEYYMRSD